MELENQPVNSDIYVNWRGKPALKGTHGGMLAASFVLVVEVLENLAFLANASNLVIYLTQNMNLSLPVAANSVTNFMGTAFLLALVGGFVSDAFFTTYGVYLTSAVIELMGLVVLTIQAYSSSLHPPNCHDPHHPNVQCEPVKGLQSAMLFIGLYIVALGVGGVKGSLAPHGAEQLDDTTSQGRKQRSTFFNYFVFSLSFGALIAVTIGVWISEHKGAQWGFILCTLAIFLSLPVFLCGSSFYRNKVPLGSPLTTICKVLIAAVLNPKPSPHDKPTSTAPSDTLTFLNRAVQNESCSIQQVEDTKIVLKLLPIFACTVILNCCLAQLTTFSVEQAATMDKRIGGFEIPPTSLPAFPVTFILILAPLYDHVIIPFARKATKSESGISHLQRIGIGLVLSILAMAVAALVEVKRKKVAVDSGLVDTISKEGLPITCLWIALQYLFLGSADLFTLAGLLEFFFTEAPPGMRSLATSLSFASLAFGFYLSGWIVSMVNVFTGWFTGKNLNHYRLERFYWLLCAMSVLNFGNYLFWAKRYKYRSGK